MPLIKTKINQHSESYQRNYLLMKEKVIELEQTMQKSSFQGEEKYRHVLRTFKKRTLFTLILLKNILQLDVPQAIFGFV